MSRLLWPSNICVNLNFGICKVLFVVRIDPCTLPLLLHVPACKNDITVLERSFSSLQGTDPTPTNIEKHWHLIFHLLGQAMLSGGMQYHMLYT